MIVLTICCSQGRDPGRLGLGAVRPQHGRLPQPHDEAQDPEGRHRHAQRLPRESAGAWLDDTCHTVTIYTWHVAGLLQRAGADLLRGPRGRRVPQVLGGQLRRPQAGAGAHQVGGEINRAANG